MHLWIATAYSRQLLSTIVGLGGTKEAAETDLKGRLREFYAEIDTSDEDVLDAMLIEDEWQVDAPFEREV